MLNLSTDGLPDYFIWNEIPTVLGNMLGGLVFTGAALYTTHAKTAPARRTSTVSQTPLPELERA